MLTELSAVQIDGTVNPSISPSSASRANCKRPTAARIAFKLKVRILNGYRSVLRTVYVLVTYDGQSAQIFRALLFDCQGAN